jgi:hypothetical protein
MRMDPSTALLPDANSPAATEPTARAQLAIRIGVESILLGAVGDALLRTDQPGLNLALWASVLAVATLLLARRRQEPLPREARWFALTAVACGAAFTWRDAAELAPLNLLGFVVAMALLAASLSPVGATVGLGARIGDYVTSGFHAATHTLFGTVPLVFGDVPLHRVPRARGFGGAVRVGRALLVTVPLLVVFGALFAQADPVFGALLRNAIRLDMSQVISHFLLAGFFAWLVGGYLRGALLAESPIVPLPSAPQPWLGATEISIGLGSLNLLFLAFVAVQFRYFFGGDALVQSTVGLSYADYARKGFFELVVVSALVLPVLLGTQALARRERAIVDRLYRTLSASLVLLVLVIMYSAAARMRLYQLAYGLTTDRVYASAFMIWLAVVFVLFAATALRGSPRHFATGVLVSGFALVGSLNVVTADTMVIRANVARAKAGAPFDFPYNASLGADAVPTLVDALDTPWARADTARCTAAARVLAAVQRPGNEDWRQWNAARRNARRVVLARAADLRRECGPQIDKPPAIAADTATASAAERAKTRR